ncbi:MAG: T9SS type A sorting domain-containing protein [Flammeovirgaceae bacterium]|nr:MAG: T9SS type A sorting domain-containing protein [Flammeovirgaceae bacterium]
MATQAAGADRFWVAGIASFWNDPANWSTTSGGAGGASVPGAADRAIFDANGVGNSIINTSISVQGIQLLSGYSGTLIQQAGFTITIGTTGFSQAAGTFVGSNADIDINSGLFTLSGGTFISTSGTLFIGGSFGANVTLLTYTGGSFLDNSGTVRLDPDFTGCAQRTATVSLSSSITFNHLILDVTNTGCTEDILTVTGSSVIVLGDLTHFDGFFNSGTIELRGNFFLEAGADGGIGTVLVNGTVDQEYSNSGSGRTAHIRVNKGSGSFNPSLTGDNLRIQQFTLDAGVFNAPAGVFRVGGTWSGSPTIFTINGGTFNHNSGTVRMDPVFGECGQRTATLSAPVAVTFHNLIIDVDNTGCTEDIFTVSGAGSVVVLNDFTQFDGFVNTGTIEVRRDVYLEAGADGGTATILLNGTSTQTYNNVSTARFAHLRVNKSSGVVNPGVGTTDFLVQQFTLDAGVFNAPTGVFRVGGTWSGSPTIFTINGGTFNHNSGTVRMDPVFGECAQRTATLSAPVAVTFHNLIIDVDNTGCTEDIFTVSGAGSVVVLNDFTQFDGFVNTGTIEVRRDVYLEAGADGGTATILLNGTSTQTYNNVSTARFAHLRVNKSSGVVNPGVGTTDFLVQQFTLDAGVFNAPTGVFRVGGTWSGSPTIFTINGGTFNHNSGTVRMDPVFGECGQRTATLSAPVAVTFHNLIIDVDNTGCTEDIFTVSGAGSVVVLNDFTQFDGFVNTGTIEVRRDVYLEAGADGGTATILLNGTSTQTYNNVSTARFAHLRVNKSSGVVNPGVGTTDFLVQQFTLDAGVFNAPTGVFRVGGTWSGSPTIFTINGGTFNHNSGTVRMDPVFGECGQRTATLSAPVAVTFHNLIIDVDNTGCTEDIFTVSGAGSVVVLNDFTQFDGFVNTGTIEVRRDVYLEAGADGGTATILLNGTSTQTYNNVSTARFAHLRVNKSSGVVNPGVGTTDFLVQQFTLDAGVFNAPTGVFRVGGTWSGSPTIFTINGGTFNHNSGTVRMDPVFGECGQRTATLSAPVAVTFHNLIIDVDNTGCTEDIFTVSGAGSVVVMNDFTQFDGFVNTGTIEVRRDVYLEAGADGGTATILLNGTSTQMYNNVSTARFAHLRVNKSSGVVNPGVGTTDFLVQQFTLDAGVFNAPTGVFRVGGTWSGSPTIFTINGGTFNHNSGTVRMDPVFPECASRTATMHVPAGATFNNLIIEVTNTGCTEDILNITGASSVVILNNLTLVNGVVNTATLDVRGNAVVQSGFDGGNAPILFSGSSPQTFDLTGAVGNFNGNVILNKTAESVTLLSSCQLDAASQSLTLTNGLLNTTSTNLLILGDNVTATGGSVNSYVNGPMQKIGNDAFTFPTGKAGIFSPIRISAPAVVSDAFLAEYFVTDPTLDGYDITLRAPTVTDVSSCDYWMLNRTAGSSSVQVTLTWNRATGCYGFSNTNILTVARWDGSEWSDAGVTATTDAGSTGTVTSALVSSFSPFAVASTSFPLPVQLVSFTANWVDRTIELAWRTATELNNNYFEVERSATGFEFEAIGRIAGAGTSNSLQLYSFIDEAPLSGISYYRLKQVDFDGTAEYSAVISVTNPYSNPGFVVYPNPVEGQVVYFTEEADVQLFNSLNQLILFRSRVTSLDVSDLSAGLYLLRNQKGEVARIIINR